MRKRERRVRLAARITLTMLLLALLVPFAYAENSDFVYELIVDYYTHEAEFAINGTEVENRFPKGNSFILDGDDRLDMKISFTPVGEGDSDWSQFLCFSSSADGSTNTTYTCRNALRLPDGSHVVFRIVNETLTFTDLYLSEDTHEVDYAFSFSGEYTAVPITLEEIREGSKGLNDPEHLSKRVDTGDAYRLRIRGSGHTLTPVPLNFDFSKGGSSWNFVLTEQENFAATYEINTGNGWESFEIASLREEGNRRDQQLLGRNFVVENSFHFKPAPGMTPTFDTLNPVTAAGVAITASMAAVGAAVASSAVSASTSTASMTSVSTGGSSRKPSILVNGGGAYPALANTKKATVELFLSMDNSAGQFYKWRAIAVVPDCVKAVTAAAIPPFGESSSVVLMLSGEPLPKKKIPVFLEIFAIGLDGEEYSTSVELTLYEKGLFAELADREKAACPESYQVTRISDGNLDGLAEIKKLKSTEYTVELQDGNAMVHVGEETVDVPL